MQSDDHDERLDIEALEKLIAAKAEGRSDELDAFAGRDERRAAAVERAKAAAAVGSTKPENPEFPEEAATDSRKGRFGVYRLLEELGRGGQGEVWLAEDTRLGRRVALKILHRGVAASDDALLRFRREGEIAAKLDHPGLCGVYDVGRENGRAWMAMRYVEGKTIARRFSERLSSPADHTAVLGEVKLVEDVARAVHVAHEAGIVHRDLKPSNLMVTKDGAAVVLDFGLAHDDSSAGSTITAPGAVFGTPAFMAPEQLLGQTGLDRRVDVYALGVVLYQALTGRLPREGPTFEAIRAVAHAPVVPARKLNPAVSKDLGVVASTALASDLSLRYRTAADLAEDLRRVRTGEPILARKAGAFVRLASWVRRNRALAAAVFGLFAVLAVGLAVSISLGLGQARALAQRDQVSDLRKSRALMERSAALWPIDSRLIDPCLQWLIDAQILSGRTELHRSARAELAQRAGVVGADGKLRFQRDEDAYFDEVLGEVLAAIERVKTEAPGIEARLARSRTVNARTLEGDAAVAWRRCIESAAKNPAYRGVAPVPRVGLVPLGPDPQFGWEEFWHVESGERPERDPVSGQLRLTAQSGIVLVLLPGGEAEMGADDDDGFMERALELPRVPMNLAPFYISKFETTQGQWMRGDSGRNPSYYFPGSDRGGELAKNEIVTLANPAESVTWLECRAMTERWGLSMPTEAQWEYACRAGTESPWYAGEQRQNAAGFGNVIGTESPKIRWTYDLQPAFHDGRILHAPVGSYRPNQFGLFDCIGNVGEWCRDSLVRDRTGARPAPGDGLLEHSRPETNRIIRGGSMQLDINYARSSARTFAPATMSRRDLGFRAAAPLR